MASDDPEIRELLTLVRLRADVKSGLREIQNADEAFKKYAERVADADQRIRAALGRMDPETQKRAKFMVRAYREAAQAAARVARDKARAVAAAQARESREAAQAAARVARDKARAVAAAQARESRDVMGEISRALGHADRALKERGRLEKVAAARRMVEEAKAQKAAMRGVAVRLNQIAAAVKQEDAIREAALRKRVAAERAAEKAITQARRAEERVRTQNARRAERVERARIRDRERAGALVGGYVTSRSLSWLGQIAARWNHALTEVVQATADKADQALINSQRLGFTSAQTQSLMYAAQIAGVPWEETMTHVRRMVDNLQDAKRGKGMSVDALKEMGLMPELMAGSLDDPWTAFLRMNKEFAGATLAQKGNWAAQIFGRSGAKLLPLLDVGVGGEGLEGLLQQAQDLGYIIDKALTDAAQKWNDELVRSRTLLQGIRNEVARVFLPVITETKKAFRLTFQANFRSIINNLRPIINLFYDLVFWASILGERIDRFVTQFGGWGPNIRRFLYLSAAVSALLATVIAGVAALSAKKGFTALLSFLGIGTKGGGLAAARASIVALAAPLGILAAALAAVAAALVTIDDLATFARGGRSTFGQLASWFFNLFLSADQAEKAVASLRRMMKSLWDLATSQVQVFYELLVTGLTAVFRVVSAITEKLTGLDLGSLNWNVAGAFDMVSRGADTWANSNRALTHIAQETRGAAPTPVGLPGDTNVTQNNTFNNTPNAAGAVPFLGAAVNAMVIRSQR